MRRDAGTRPVGGRLAMRDPRNAGAGGSGLVAPPASPAEAAGGVETGGCTRSIKFVEPAQGVPLRQAPTGSPLRLQREGWPVGQVRGNTQAALYAALTVDGPRQKTRSLSGERRGGHRPPFRPMDGQPRPKAALAAAGCPPRGHSDERARSGVRHIGDPALPMGNLAAADASPAKLHVDMGRKANGSRTWRPPAVVLPNWRASRRGPAPICTN